MTSDYDPNYIEKSPALFRVSQKAVLTDAHGEILVLKRSKLGGGEGWSFPGGGLDEGEDALASIRREIREETGLDADDLRVFHVFVSAVRKDDLVIGYTGRAAGEVTLNWEHDEYRWMTPAEALDLHLTIHAREHVRRFIELNG